MDDKYKQALSEDINRYSKLKSLKQSPDFSEYLEFLNQSAAAKMIQTFVGEKAPTYEEFLALWGEVRGKLHVLQEVGGAEAIEQQLIKTLREYNTPSAT